VPREIGDNTGMETTEKRQRGRPRAFNGPSEAASVQSLDRALRILAIVAEASGLSLSEIAARSGVAASTAYRMLTTLANHGMVEFDSTDQLWSIGVETYRMGAAFLRSRKLRRTRRQLPINYPVTSPHLRAAETLFRFELGVQRNDLARFLVE